MRKSLRNLGSLLLVCSLVGMSLTGCSQKAEEKTASDTASEAVAENKEFSYPMKTDKTLTYWIPLNVNVSANYGNLGETDFIKSARAIRNCCRVQASCTWSGKRAVQSYAAG